MKDELEQIFVDKHSDEFYNLKELNKLRKENKILKAELIEVRKDRNFIREDCGKWADKYHELKKKFAQ